MASGDDPEAPPRTRPSTTEERLAAVTLGEVRPLNGTVRLAPYDPAWPSLFARLAAPVRKALGGNVVLLEHVGSTSVPGLSAKPVIDMVLAVADSADEGAYVPPLAELGYVLRIREPDWFEHRVLKAPDVDGNLHVFSAGCAEIDRMLTFRDWLRRHARDRKLYEDTKRKLSERSWTHLQDYADAKSRVIAEIMVRARRAGV